MARAKRAGVPGGFHTPIARMDSRLRVPLTVAVLAVVSMPSAIGAQTCAPPEHPAFEFQVTQPAEYRGDTVRVPRPAPARFVSIREQLLQTAVVH